MRIFRNLNKQKLDKMDTKIDKIERELKSLKNNSIDTEKMIVEKLDTIVNTETKILDNDDKFIQWGTSELKNYHQKEKDLNEIIDKQKKDIELLSNKFMDRKIEIIKLEKEIEELKQVNQKQTKYINKINEDNQKINQLANNIIKINNGITNYNHNINEKNNDDKINDLVESIIDESFKEVKIDE